MHKHIKFDTNSRRGYARIPIKEFVDEYLYSIDLDADYQREKVWTHADQELLLDSIAHDIDIPKLYLALVSDNKQFDYECIDGKQRMVTLLNFYKPEQNTTENQKPIKIKVFENKFTYKELVKEHPSIAKKIDEYNLDFIVYKKQAFEENENYIRLIFKRLNLGYELNSGEMLKAKIGTVRDFVFKKIGKEGFFFRNTSLSDKRCSREFTLAQIVVNSFKKKETGKYIRVRLPELENFFEDQYKLSLDDQNFTRIQRVLEAMEQSFGDKAKVISSRGFASSAYFFFEYLYENNKKGLFVDFVDFYIKLLEEIKANLTLMRDLKEPKNKKIIEEFQRYVSQASAEASSFDRREKFLKEAFEYYLDPKTKGKIIGSR